MEQPPPPTTDADEQPPAPPPPVLPGPYVCKGWRKARIIGGVATAFFFFFTIPGWAALRSYRRWRDGEDEKPPAGLRVWSWAWPPVLAILIAAAFWSDPPESSQPKSDDGAIIVDDFSDPGTGWRTLDDARGTIGYEAGAYSVRAKQAPDTEYASVSVDESHVAVEVSADAIYAASSPRGFFGVGCLSEDHATSYDFMIDPTRGTWLIIRSGSRGKVISFGRDTDALIRSDGPNHVTGRCLGGGTGTPVTLVMDVNGAELGRTVQQQGVGPFDGIELGVLAPKEGGVQAVFDNARMTVPS